MPQLNQYEIVWYPENVVFISECVMSFLEKLNETQKERKKQGHVVLLFNT